MQGKRESKWKAAAWCLAASFVLLSLCSMSSPLYPINIWDDANCLMTVGRMMKEGGVLYRDIYEQKGPLLYGIHLLAAMISDSSFLGVFVLEVVAFAATLYAAQRLLRLWLDEQFSTAGMILFGGCVLISRAFSRGDSAEEFCLPFLMAALLIVCHAARRRKDAPDAKSMLLLGVLAGCVAAIKYTVLGLFVGICLAQGIWQLAQRQMKPLLLSACAFLCGMLLALLPWVLYFAANGALGDAYTAYIHNNIFLYNAQKRTLTEILGEIAAVGQANMLWALPAAGGVLAFAVNKKHGGYARLCVALAALCTGAAVFLPGTVYPYYPLVLCVFAPFGLLSLLGAAQRRRKAKRFVVVAAAWAVLCAAFCFSPNAFLRGVPLNETAQGRLAAQIEEGATLLQYSHLDDGLYMLTGHVPQEKYFVRLNVDLPEMEEALDSAVREGRPDYVLVSWRELPAQYDQYELIAVEAGYDHDNRPYKTLYLYKRKGMM